MQEFVMSSHKRLKESYVVLNTFIDCGCQLYIYIITYTELNIWNFGSAWSANYIIKTKVTNLENDDDTLWMVHHLLKWNKPIKYNYLYIDIYLYIYIWEHGEPFSPSGPLELPTTQTGLVYEQHKRTHEEPIWPNDLLAAGQHCSCRSTPQIPRKSFEVVLPPRWPDFKKNADQIQPRVNQKVSSSCLHYTHTHTSLVSPSLSNTHTLCVYRGVTHRFSLLRCCHGLVKWCMTSLGNLQLRWFGPSELIIHVWWSLFNISGIINKQGHRFPSAEEIILNVNSR